MVVTVIKSILMVSMMLVPMLAKSNEPKSSEALCELYGNIAERVMTNRQNGYSPIENLREVTPTLTNLKKSGLSDSAYLVVREHTKGTIKRAYQVPISGTSDNKAANVRYFKRRAIEKCEIDLL